MSDDRASNPLTRHRTDLHRFADYILDGRMDEIVRELREEGKSWETAARYVWLRTDELIDISGQTLQNWYRGEIE